MHLDTMLEHFELATTNPSDLDPKATTDTHVALELVPHNPRFASAFKTVRLLLDAQQGDLQHIKINNTDGDQTTIHFTNPLFNRHLTDKDLDLVLPEGTKVSKPLEGVGDG